MLLHGHSHGEFVSQIAESLAARIGCRLEFREFVAGRFFELMTSEPHCVFVAGGTGYMGQCLVPTLLKRGHVVRALVRPGSKKKVPAGCTPVVGNALDGDSYVHQISPADTFVQMVGVAHPSPAKAAEFREVDLPAGLEAVKAPKAAGIRHFVYLSVAHPAPMMQAYIAVRAQCEAAIEASGLNATILRPWYVLGPGTAGHTFYYLYTRWLSWSCRRAMEPCGLALWH
jgi:nucleoside-diphosphate-sugar epimerase